MSKYKRPALTEEQIGEIFKENCERIKNAMSELKTNKIVSHKQIFDALKKADKCKTVDEYIDECKKQNITFRKRISLKARSFKELKEREFDVFYINGYFFLSHIHPQIICPKGICLDHALFLNDDIESLRDGLENFIEYSRIGNVEITENSFVYTDTWKDLSIDFTDYKKYIVREMDFEDNSIIEKEIPNKNISNYGENIANNSTTKTNKEVNINNSCPSFDCGLCSFFSSCCGGG